MDEIEKKQKSLGELDPEQKEVYAIVKKRISAMNKKQKFKLLMKKSSVQKLIDEAREEPRDES